MCFELYSLNCIIFYQNIVSKTRPYISLKLLYSCNIIVFTYYNIICTNIFFVALILSENISFIHNKGYLPNELHLSSMHIMIISWAVFSHGNWYAIKDNKCHFRVMYLFRSRHQLFRKYKLKIVNKRYFFFIYDKIDFFWRVGMNNI